MYDRGWVLRRDQACREGRSTEQDGYSCNARDAGWRRAQQGISQRARRVKVCRFDQQPHSCDGVADALVCVALESLRCPDLAPRGAGSGHGRHDVAGGLERAAESAAGPRLAWEGVDPRGCDLEQGATISRNRAVLRGRSMVGR